MYHPESTDPRTHRRSVLIVIASVAIAIVVALFVFQSAQSAIREQGALSMRTAILDSAKRCCAVEGAYPRSLKYLEEHYGLVVNDVAYLVTYECYADNVVPSVVVMPR